MKKAGIAKMPAFFYCAGWVLDSVCCDLHHEIRDIEDFLSANVKTGE
jgi:hypothetical protein